MPILGKRARGANGPRGPLAGSTVATLGLPSDLATAVARTVASLGGEVIDGPGAQTTCSYLLVAYWYSLDRTVHSATVVTLHWLEEVAAARELLPPAQSPYFQPPLPCQQLVYPVEGYVDFWDATHLHLPSSPHSQLGNGIPLWPYIAGLLAQPIPHITALQRTILQIVGDTSSPRCLVPLYKAVQSLPPADQSIFFDTVLPAMQALALELPLLFPASVPLLTTGSNATVVLTKRQAACLLVHGFFCTFPEDVPDTFPHAINFWRLHSGRADHSKVQKLVCLLHYFCRVACVADPSTLARETVSFARVGLDVAALVPSAFATGAPWAPVSVRSTGAIETDEGALQMDFANKFAGGGVLGRGCVQEEIRFVINPECIVSCALTQVLENNECFVIQGAEQYATYCGYGGSFAFDADFVDTTPVDAVTGRRNTVIVGIDATKYAPHTVRHQFRYTDVVREIGKAFVGFAPLPDEAPGTLRPVATGNWGCGVFGGDVELKFMLQWIAASLHGRRMTYYTFGNAVLGDALNTTVEKVAQHLSVQQVYQILKAHGGPRLFEALSQHCPAD
ncbi:poly(adp-ribose) glycohydrolase [Achlya hypogyna]|uniref:poly(ADP-ribose) glycohydrolase n=1 Tax=Achlya hypogyna TaxID=1202772 RepID=A0A1V9YC24_ACHHY|nr:poly(adp-ribose) glycohydrolase [Achlya hypogyna]